MTTGARDTIITETDFEQRLAGRMEEVLPLFNLLMQLDTRDWLKRHYIETIARSHDLETFLDDHGARNNKRFSYLVELVASLRGFGKMAVAVKHFMGRFSRYHLRLDAGLERRFFAETDRTLRFFNQSLLALIREFRRELAHLGMRSTDKVRADSTVSDEGNRSILPHTIDEAEAIEEERRIAEVATRYLAAADRFAWGVCGTIDDAEELRKFVLSRFDEEQARHYESVLHSLQSKYDTYVKGTAIEASTTCLAPMRGHASLALHLLEVGTELIHFYVRHENDVRSEEVKAQVARLIDKGAVLDRAVNYSLHFGSRIFQAGRAFAEEALRAVVRVQELKVRVPDGETLHARPISLIVRIVQHHGTRVQIRVGDETCDASSIMEVIMLAGSQPDSREVVFSGDERVLKDLKLLFESGLGEAGMQNLPTALSYLR